MELLDAGRVEEGIAKLTAVAERVTEESAGTAPLAAFVGLTDAHLWTLRLAEGLFVGEQGMRWALERGQRETYRFSVLVTNTVACHLLLGEVDPVGRLVSTFLRPELKRSNWLLHQAEADLEVRKGKLASALDLAEKLATVDYLTDEQTMQVSATTAEARLWQGHPDQAWASVGKTLNGLLESLEAVRSSPMLTLAARAAAELSKPADSDRVDLSQTLRRWADHSGCYEPHPFRTLGEAYGATFEAELARLHRNGQEAAWRRAKDVWAGHLVPHPAAYAGWRLAECLLDAGQRRSAEGELAVAYAAARGHVPLRAAIEGLARRARLALPTDPVDSRPSEKTGDLAPPHGLTARELDVLRLLGTGATNAEIGAALYMSPKTASVHVSAIIRKLGVSGRVQAATVAERMGLLADADDHDGSGLPQGR